MVTTWIRLLRDYKGWKKGDVVEYDAEPCKRLVRKRFAEFCSEPSIKPQIETAEAKPVAETADVNPQLKGHKQKRGGRGGEG